MPRVEITNLKKSFGSQTVVHDFDLSVADGEFVALLGPSGCGKSTVLRMIAGISEPDAGSIRVGERTLNGLPPERRNIGLFFQSYALFPHMSVASNVGFGLRMRGVARAQISSRVTTALELMELGGLAARMPRQLSGGQQQRVALARALVIEPDLLLLDEPLSSLDAQLRDQLREEIRGLQKRLGITAIYVTHDQSEALALADRVVVMRSGRIVETGTPVDLYRRPKSRFTASFVGQTNLIEVAVSEGAIQLPWGQRVATDRAISAPGRRLVVSLRPEDIQVAPDSAGPGEIINFGFLGADIDYHVRVGGTVLRARSSGAGAVLHGRGTPVSLLAAGGLHVIDEDAA